LASSSSKASYFNPARLGLCLLVVLAALFFFFMGTAAFAPGLFAKPIMPGGALTMWFAFAFGLIWTSVLATGLYVFIVNTAEDRQ
jgi:uncharacterized membrane protein (DUF485 family)